MNFNDGTTNRDLNSSKTAVDASHESGDSKDVATTKQEQLDGVAMESAKRANNRIHSDEQEIPGSTIFSK
ncbi:hypothetical protein [Granulicella tundricola]|uniref:Uncharacterized protein n=1 Tax=Granulicella tundricola (strain ATCC BAA-1859 / DSM 23138 / MP5ACTX9) TaxID=1198114 RepID=E8WVJ2_GRATM|nr:hypothetical protein [Granulicella tundricola]ADW68440.1 hypothetical protein AciX9_1381 [Granulicella tundricola MP5ACTX9]